MAEEQKRELHHSLTLIGRESLVVEGVIFVESFDNEGLSLSTKMGDITVEGRDLKIEGFSKEEGIVRIHGLVTGIFSPDEARPRKKFIERLFK